MHLVLAVQDHASPSLAAIRSVDEAVPRDRIHFSDTPSQQTPPDANYTYPSELSPRLQYVDRLESDHQRTPDSPQHP